MADKWQSAWVEVLPDFSDFKNRADREITSSLGKAGTSGGHALKTGLGTVFAGSFLGNFAAEIGTRLLGGIVSGVASGIGAGIDYALEGIQLAGALSEQVNAVQVSYGDLADEILSLSKQAPQNLNLTQAAFNRLAVRFSSFAKTIARDGRTADQIIGDLTQRGADFASVYDIEVDEALSLFQSGLAGETEPLRRFGLDLSAARVEAFAYANGIAASGDELTEAQKVQARYGTLLEQTSQVQGDLANTAGSLANQQRSLNVAWEEAQTKAGEFLIPAFTSIVTYANDNLLPKLDQVVDTVGPIFAQALEDAGPEIKQFIDEDLAPLAEKFATMAAEDGIPAVIDLLKSIADVAPLLADSAVEDIELLTDFMKLVSGDFSPFWEANPELAQSNPILDILRDLGVDVSEADQIINQYGKGWGEAFTSGLDEGFDGVRPVVSGTVDEVDAELRRGGGGSFARGEDVANGLIRGMQSKKGEVGIAAGVIAQAALDSLQNKLKIQSPSKVTEELGGYVVEGFVNGILGGASKVQSAMSSTLGFNSTYLASVSPTSTQASSGSERPIYADGVGLIGWIREEATGQAQLVFNNQLRNQTIDTWAGDL